MGVMPHPFHTTVRLEKLWVAMGSLASASSTSFSTEAEDLRSRLSLNISFNKCMVRLCQKGMNGRQHDAIRVLPHTSHTSMRLEKLWVAMGSLASASANHFAAVTQVLRSSLSQDSHQLQGISGG